MAALRCGPGDGEHTGYYGNKRQVIYELQMFTSMITLKICDDIYVYRHKHP